jgi:hypothetical protein
VAVEEQGTGLMRKATRREGRLAVVLVAAGLLLAACGAGAPHVIGPGAKSTTTSPTSTPPSTAPGPAPTTAPTTTTTLPGSLTPAEVNQIDAELNTLENSLTQTSNSLSTQNSGDSGS